MKDPNDLETIRQNKEKYWYDYIDEDLMKAAETGEAEAEISFFLDDSDEGRAKLEEVKGLEERMRQAAAAAGCACNVKEDGAPEAKEETVTGKAVFELRHRIVDDEDWKDKWKEFFSPTRITDHITVKPTWEDYSPEEGEKVIEIDPGMAFGTGTHETTSSCIALIEKYVKDAGAGRELTVLDVGCGSGILSIAAAVTGCGHVTGVDLDPDAVEAAVGNVRLNHVEDMVTILKGDLAEGLDIRADMVVANLTVNLIERLLSDISDHMAEDGIFIASGILTEQEQQAKDAMKAQGLEIMETVIKGDWCTIASAKKI